MKKPFDYKPEEVPDEARKLARAMYEHGTTQAMLARYVGVPSTMVWQWVHGKRPIPLLHVERIAHVLPALSPSDLNPAYTQMKSSAPAGASRALVDAYEIRGEDEGELGSDDDVLIEEVEVRLAAGAGSIAPEFVPTKRKLVFSNTWLRRKKLSPKNLRLMAVHGESMSPTLSSGDTVLIDTSDKKVVDGRIYAFIVGREARIKRLRWNIDGAITVISDNADKRTYPDETLDIDRADELYIIGRAVQRSGDL